MWLTFEYGFFVNEPTITSSSAISSTFLFRLLPLERFKLVEACDRKVDKIEILHKHF